MERFLTYIAKQVNGLNLLLAVVLVVLAYFTILPIYRLGARFNIPGPKNGPAATQRDPVVVDFVPANYAVLTQENLFHPDRKIPPAKKEVKALPKPEITLYGTYITSATRLAFIEEKSSPMTSPGRGQRHTVIKQGEKILGFELKQIEPNRITLVRDKEIMTVSLEAKKQRSGGAGSVGAQSPYVPNKQPASLTGQQYNPGQTGAGRPIAPIPAPPPPPPIPAVRPQQPQTVQPSATPTAAPTSLPVIPPRK